jgi:hypothetical protein
MNASSIAPALLGPLKPELASCVPNSSAPFPLQLQDKMAHPLQYGKMGLRRNVKRIVGQSRGNTAALREGGASPQAVAESALRLATAASRVSCWWTPLEAGVWGRQLGKAGVAGREDVERGAGGDVGSKT